MKIGEATPADRESWDRFVDTQNGCFKHYYDWKYVCENRKELSIQLIVKDDSNRIISIFPVSKTKRALYPSLYSCGPLFKKGLAAEEKYDLTQTYLDYLDEHYTKGASLFRLEDLALDGEIGAVSALETKINPVFVKNGFRLRYDASTGLPCLHVLALDQPFDEKIWKRLWTDNLKQNLKKAKNRGIAVFQDSELDFLDEYIRLLRSNFKRHGSRPPSREEIKAEFQLFKNKSKLFVALLENQPVMITSCHYTLSTCYLWQVGAGSKNNRNAQALSSKVAIKDACDAGYKYANFGFTYSSGVARYKDHFKGQRIPAMVYEKRYSIPGAILELTPKFIENLRYDKTYLRDNRHAILDKFIHW